MLESIFLISALAYTIAYASARLIRICSTRMKVPIPVVVPIQGKVKEKIDEDENVSKYQALRNLRHQHEVAAVMSRLIDEDGAGAWPPNANHDSWPMALRPYKEVYFQLIPLLSAAPPSLDDDVNNERRRMYRSIMRKSLMEKVNIPQVVAVMAAVEAGNWDLFPRDAYNGFYCCVAVCRHAYRWATIPVVKVAQLEKIVEFPSELDAPWPYLQRNFGVNADAGNNTSNVLLNFNTRGERIYRINVGMSDLIRSSEEVFFQMFYDLEVVAFPIYHEMVLSIIAYASSSPNTCLPHLHTINARLRDLFLVFYENLTKSRVSHSVWLSYIQGFQGWGVGKMVNGEYVKYDGLSGNHVLFFQALDAFLGMDRYLSDENMERYIPIRQRELCLAFKKYSFIKVAHDEGLTEIEEEFAKMINQLKVFRAAHRARVMSYLQEPAPERLVMTAGKSVLENSNTNGLADALKPLDDMLATRLKETANVGAACVRA
ncbi:407eb133-dff1-43af-a450-16cd04a5ef6e [Sclerotinia trifoliorum]|uniref:Indoleamine 2,3-dioxygenase n=1 Tax=Sclerotinia trifoliorum TaxID=28548 RepID=A0A8H2VMI0_9HELO|nr:407eb133-dff1-43af-a450-16cd04a5ef6e [Sclerotinia trifoliorum]